MLVALTILGGCTAPARTAASGSQGAGACPSHSSIAVVWSSEYESDSIIKTVGGDGPAREQKFAARGISPQPNGVVIRQADSALMVANGSAQRESTYLVGFNATSCAVTRRQVSEQLVSGLASEGDAIITANTVNGETVVRRRVQGEGSAAELRLPGLNGWTLVMSGGRLYVLGQEPVADRAILTVVNLSTMKMERRVNLAGAGSVGPRAVVHRGDLYYTIPTLPGDRPGSAVGVIHLADLTQRSIPLEHEVPYLLEVHGDQLYIGHTYLNPAFEQSGYKTITQIDLVKGAQKSVEVEGWIRDLVVEGDRLLVLAGQQGPLTLSELDLETLAAQRTTRVEPPEGENYQPAALLAVGRR